MNSNDVGPVMSVEFDAFCSTFGNRPGGSAGSPRITENRETFASVCTVVAHIFSSFPGLLTKI